MHPLVFIGIFIGTFALMEVITWLTHRFVMHGFLWYLHEDHHQKGPGFFEKNDAFFLIFGIPTFFGILYGTIYDVYWLLAVCYGVMAYGVAYFMVHDVIIHQRFKWFSRSNNTYVKAIRWGHKMHHKHLEKHDGECFGMLVVHKKYWDKIRRDKVLKQSMAKTTGSESNSATNNSSTNNSSTNNSSTSDNSISNSSTSNSSTSNSSISNSSTNTISSGNNSSGSNAGKIGPLANNNNISTSKSFESGI